MTDLSDVQPIAVSEWDSRLAPIVAEMRGRPLNVHKLMANNPELLLAWWNFRKHVVRGGKLKQRHRELIILRVAVHMKSWYEWASHVDRGLKAGLSSDEIECVRLGRIASHWDRSDELVLRAINECFDNQKITLETRIAMRAYFSPAELMDLIAIFGAYVTLGTMINTWGLELDEYIRTPERMDENSWLRP
jgi:alkylhydroperoxidase/carboxymuconolactone decarboxylase family protein YurZ